LRLSQQVRFAAGHAALGLDAVARLHVLASPSAQAWA
jgi:hypothetical protein